ncbi:hypothetical protein ACGF5M_05670 [Gemmatimonadota bacterium]
MRTARDILATVTFLGTALVFYLVQTAPQMDAMTNAKFMSSSAVEQCQYSNARMNADTPHDGEHLSTAEGMTTRES